MEALDQCIDFLGSILEPEDIIEFRPLPPAAGRAMVKARQKFPISSSGLLAINRV